MNREQLRKHIGEAMVPHSMALLFSGSAKAMSWDIDYPFFPNRNFLYATGWEEKDAALLLFRQGDALEEWLFVQRPSDHTAMHYGGLPHREEAARRTGIAQVGYLDELEWQLSRLLSRQRVEACYLDFPARGLESVGIENRWAARLTKNAPYLALRQIGPVIANLRRYKDPEELEQICGAIDITGRSIAAMLEQLAPGRFEYELEAAFDYAVKLAGAQGCAFPSIFAGGTNSQLIHYPGKSGRLEQSDLLLVDLGAQLNHYAADISRTYPVGGKFTPEQAYFYEAVLESQHQLIQSYLRPGADHRATVDVARRALAPYLLKKGLIVAESETARYLPHGVCHFLGLDTHDPGDMDTLRPGMVITCEPGVYLPELGFGIRIEDDILITENGCRVLSAGIPKELAEIEALLQ